MSAAEKGRSIDMKLSENTAIRLIAIFKLFKACLLIAVGIAALTLVHHSGDNAFEHWISTLGLNPGARYLDRAIGKVASISPHRLRELGVGSFFYAALFLTEGIGLWLKKHWAEWFTTIITASLIPLEIFELYHHPTVSKVGVLAINIAVVVYLALRLRRERGMHSN